jgi:hypothetical protein
MPQLPAPPWKRWALARRKKSRKAGAALAAVFHGKTKGAGWFTVALALLHHRQFD